MGKACRQILIYLVMIFATVSAWANPPERSDVPREIDSLGAFIGQNKLLNKIADKSTEVGSRASAMVIQALSFLGVPYKFGGVSSKTGFDCSGFVLSVVKDAVGKVLPREAREQAQATIKIPRSDLEPGDLVFFNTRHFAYSHVGIYLGDDRFIHSPSSGSTVRIDKLSQFYWAKRFDGARRVQDSGEAMGVSSLSQPVEAPVYTHPAMQE